MMNDIYGGERGIRDFTPAIEVPLCGHATLTSAFILWEEGVVLHYEEIVFHAKGGTLKIQKEKDIIKMDFPISCFKLVLICLARSLIY